MFKRRELLPLASGFSSLAALFTGREARATTKDVRVDPKNISPEMRERFGIQMTTLDRQSAEDFYGSFRQAFAPKYEDLEADVQATLQQKGIKADPNCSLEEAWNLCMLNPRFAMKSRTWISGQQLMWNGIGDSFHEYADRLLSELETTDKRGPGTLELNPDMKVPEYCRYEIHIQPGGYVGDAFSGAIAAYGSKYFDRANLNLYNDHQERMLGMAQEIALPRSGDVTRVLDMGTGWGPLATALKVRFPESEVWGIDVGGPMVRWAHYRAIKMGLEVNYAQRLAEESKFQNDHFDMVVSHIMHHEVTAAATKKIVAEAFRVLRPGGVFQPIDFTTVGNPRHKEPQTLTEKASAWWNHRYNNEVWIVQYRNTDLPGLMRSAGFVDVHASAKAGLGEVIGYKPA